MPSHETDDFLTIEQADELAGRLTNRALRIESREGGILLSGPAELTGIFLKPSQMTRLGITEAIAELLSW